MIIEPTAYSHHPVIEELSEVLSNKTGNENRNFFRIEVAYFLAKMASSMRVDVWSKDRGLLPVNVYAICLNRSGTGKNYSMNILEEGCINAFRERFTQETMPSIVSSHLLDLASSRALKEDSDEDTKLESLRREYESYGAYPFTFDSGTSPALKQLRDKLLLGSIGSINFEVDEIGSNLLSSTEMLNVYLELYDKGLTKLKLIKASGDQQRATVQYGSTPANMLLFGTPVKLLDGAEIENAFYSFLEIGFARRCLFGTGARDTSIYENLSAEEIYDHVTNAKNDEILAKWRNKFEGLADKKNFHFKTVFTKERLIQLIDYEKLCAEYAASLSDLEEIKRTEALHRSFKARKLAGIFSFIDGEEEISEENLKRAILLVEESADNLNNILHREKSYMKLARFIGESKGELTQADLMEALPFYKGGIGTKKELMDMAIAWGYKQRIIITRKIQDNIEFFSGEKLEDTDLSKLILSMGQTFADGYRNCRIPFSDLHKLGQTQGWHWVNHHLTNGHRDDAHIIEGFNLIVLDIDNSISIESFKKVFHEYKYVLYETKRSTPEENRFRVIIPISHVLKFDTETYRQFIRNILSWLPFTVDESVEQRAKKWLTSDKSVYVNEEGKVLDILRFIPNTSRNDEYVAGYEKIKNLDNVERWFYDRISFGNRNNELMKYAFFLGDDGMPLDQLKKRVLSFNKKLKASLSDEEIKQTIFKTLEKRYG